MKRRNADCGKLRRPIKRNKISEGMYGSNTLLYIKFLVLWAIVITADFMLEFRFEFLWPFWLLLRSVHDSFKYKGLAFSVLFVCIAITSDLVCLFFIPVHWLFFAASTYVWVQYVWHTDKGICLPTIILWMLFVYLEAAIRWKDSRHMPHLDLCRPFAAHCIGYPVVTLGFGFKSYVGYRMRQRKQREVAKENEFYMQLLQQALPQDETQETGLSTSEQQASGQQDIQQKELSPVPAISHNNNNNSTNNKNNAQNNSKHNNNNSNSHNSNLFNSSNGHVMMSTVHQSVMPQNVSNGLNHLHNNSHKNNSHRRSLDKESTQINSNFLNTNSKLTDSSTNFPTNNGSGVTTIALNSSATSSSSKTSNINSNSSTQSSNHRDPSSSCHSNHGGNGLSKKDHDNSKHNGDLKLNDSSSSHSHNHQHHNGHCVTENTSRNKHNQNGSIQHYDAHESNDTHQMPTVTIAQPIETVIEKHKSSGRKNRVRQKNNLENVMTSSNSSNSSISKDNQHDAGAMQQQPQPQFVSQHQQTMPQVCESCTRLENEAKKMKQEINHLKQAENELRQKIDTSINYKNCLQAKQRDNEDLEKRIQELTNSRQLDRQNLQNVERRLGDERRQKQSLDSQLNNERKQRKLAEERASRSDCSDLCKMKKQQLEMECNKLRRDFVVMEDAKNNFEHQNRNYEQELQKFKNEIRNREQQQGTEVLMSALNAMQVKNSTLEKNLSDETRVKLDLFSALGEAKRQLEISDSHLRTKDKEVNDLQTKIAQLLAVMPCHDSLCIGNSSSNSSSILRVNDTPPLLQQQQSNQQSIQQQQQGSGGGGGGGGQSSPLSQLGLSVSPLLGQLSNLGVLKTSTPPPPQISISTSSATSMSSSGGGGGGVVVVNGQQVQMQNSSGSNLDPNATAYTPKNNNLATSSSQQQSSSHQVGGTEA